ncbi:MAG: SMI1/KNR4 family protein [Bacilli bacterium]|nr:SMI1/KNR4 family protein [Bacilli bacterium]
MLNLIKNVEEKINYSFPQDYASYIKNSKPLRFEKNLFKTSNNEEKVLRYLYSFDENERNYIIKFQSFDSQFKDKIVPFAELEFGDLLCFDRNNNNIVLYNHELDEIEIVANSFTEFLGKLYN